MIICEVRKIENSRLSLFKFIQANIILIIIKFIVNKPLKPSTKLAPLIMNRKHNNTNIEDKI